MESNIEIDGPRLRDRMKNVAAESGLSYADIGLLMGMPDAESARNKVNYLLNRSDDPGVLTVLSFCSATGITLRDLLSRK